MEIRTNGWTVSINVEIARGSASTTRAAEVNAGMAPPPPGYHYMPDGSLMRDSDMPSSGGGTYTNTGNNTGAGAGTSNPSGY